MIDKRKKYIMVIDIETTNGLTDMLAYDIGFIVADLHGNIYEQRSYMVAELFCDERYKYLLDTAYYKNKLPSYWEEYREGNRQIKTILSTHYILFCIKRMVNIYNIPFFIFIF